jgi:rifampicin phosphotransferase
MQATTLSTVDSNVVKLDRPEACAHALVGGKGANLGRLAQAGYPVPPAFTITTEAYATFLEGSGLRSKVGELLEGIDYDEIESLETATAQIRGLLEGTEVPPELGEEIARAYGELAAEHPYVAVRSSGTAEDLAGTSFAGLHDTYLDVRGADAVIDATKRCWASLWSARATTYRRRNGFDHFDARLAVVVQTMVSSDVSGVMFTGNPRTAATDETVINASWGLGEAIVQGIVTPDEFVVQSGNSRLLERTLGDKQQQIVRDPDTGVGVITEDVLTERRGQFCLTDEQVKRLVALGRRVTAHYDGYPQDIEWAIADDQLYLLQARPITGVDFAWDADVDAWHSAPDDPFAIGTRALADEIWTGAITPLHYSWVGPMWNVCFYRMVERLGRPDLVQHRIWEYHRAYLYWNCQFEKELMCDMTLPVARAGSLKRLPDSWHEDAMKSPFGVIDYLKQQLRILTNRPDLGPYAWFRLMYDYFENRIPQAEGLSNQELRQLDDAELERYTRKHELFEGDYNDDVASTGLCYYFRDAMSMFAWVVANWYTGENPIAYAQLLSGTPNITATIDEHIRLARLAKLIRESPQLSQDFAGFAGTAFFDALPESEEGRAFAPEIDAFIARSGHRGHADRDIIFPRYCEDLGALYRALELHLKSEDDPIEMHQRNAEVRSAAYDDVIENLRRQPLGFLKVEAFKLLFDYCHKGLELRDNEREYIDRHTFAVKRCFQEVGRRIYERGGIFESERDFYFLTQDELFDVLHGRANLRLIRYKIDGRMRNWDRLNRKEVKLPKYLQRNHGLPEESTSGGVDEHGRRIYHGAGNSPGEITATARVIKRLEEIGRVNKGEIMVTNSTDPGWTPVFAALSGVIVETGGLLSHSGCLAREYGFPAAQIENAVTLIPDGATITLNGDTGWVRIESEEPAAELVEAVA